MTLPVLEKCIDLVLCKLWIYLIISMSTYDKLSSGLLRPLKRHVAFDCLDLRVHVLLHEENRLRQD